MQYEYIGHTPNRHEFVKNKRYYINPKREDTLVICNIQEVVFELGKEPVAKPLISGLIYDDVPMFRRDWKVVSSELVQSRTEAVELAK